MAFAIVAWRTGAIVWDEVGVAEATEPDPAGAARVAEGSGATDPGGRDPPAATDADGTGESAGVPEPKATCVPVASVDGLADAPPPSSVEMPEVGFTPA